MDETVIYYYRSELVRITVRCRLCDSVSGSCAFNLSSIVMQEDDNGQWVWFEFDCGTWNATQSPMNMAKEF
jgi:hypothetical protein